PARSGTMPERSRSDPSAARMAGFSAPFAPTRSSFISISSKAWVRISTVGAGCRGRGLRKAFAAGRRAGAAGPFRPARTGVWRAAFRQATDVHGRGARFSRISGRQSWRFRPPSAERKGGVGGVGELVAVREQMRIFTGEADELGHHRIDVRAHRGGGAAAVAGAEAVQNFLVFSNGYLEAPGGEDEPAGAVEVGPGLLDHALHPGEAHGSQDDVVELEVAFVEALLVLDRGGGALIGHVALQRLD